MTLSIHGYFNGLCSESQFISHISDGYLVFWYVVLSTHEWLLVGYFIALGL
jgi:hypothetical protein